MVLTVDAGRGPEVAFGILAAAGYFDVYGTPPLLGRTLAPGSFADAGIARDPHFGDSRDEVVLSHGFWRESMGGDPDVLGKTILISKRAFVVVGVMQADFFGSVVKLWVPLDSLGLHAPDHLHLLGDREARIFNVHTRVRADCDDAMVRAELAAAAALLAQDFPDTHAGVTARLAGPRNKVAAKGPVLLLLQAAAVAVLLVVAINYAYLLSVHRLGLAREMGIRAALGAGPRQLAAALVLQSLFTTLVGGLLGALLGVALIRVWIARSTLFLPGSEHIGLQIPVLLVALGSVLVVGFAAALVPAWSLGRIEVWRAIAPAPMPGVAARSTPSAAFGRSGTIVVQTAASVALLGVTTLLMGNLLRLLRVDPGFSPSSVLTLTVAVPFGEEDLARFYGAALAEIESLPEVESATVIGDPPLEGRSGTSCWLTLVDAPGSALREPRESTCVPVGPRFQETLHATLLRGRSLRAPDDYRAVASVMVNSSMADLLWSGEDVVGHSLVIQRTTVDFPDAKPETVQIVGVLGDILHNAPGTRPVPAVYLPEYWHNMTFLVRTRGEPTRGASAVKAAIWRIDADLPFSRIEGLETTVERSISGEHNAARLVGLFGIAALFNAAFGLFVVLSSQVSTRRRELAIRLALGASPRRLVRQLLASAATLTAIGSVLGLILAASLGPVMSKLVYDAKSADGWALTAPPVVMLLAAIGASYLPARRAARVDPAANLRAD
jgi:predicted permease